MTIRGDLLSVDLSNVFQMLALNRKGGRLTVQDQGNLRNKRRLYVKDDRVALHESLPERPLEAVLVAMEVLSYERYREVLEKSARYGTEPARLLQQMGILDEAQEDSVRRRIAEEGVLEVFLWRHLTFELDEVAEPPSDDAPYFGIDHLIMESARRQDEWAEFVETPGVDRQIYICGDPSSVSAVPDLEPVSRIVLDHVDGERGSPQIVEQTGLPRYFVDVSLSVLHQAGHIQRLGFSDLMATGDRLVASGSPGSALHLFRTALQFDRRDLALHGRLAHAYRADGRVAKSAAHHRFCATRHLDAGRRRDAITLYQTVLEMLPTDFRTLERCLELLAEEGSIANADDHRVCENARKLLTFYLDTRQDERALVIIEGLQRLVDDAELIGFAARLYMRTGQTEKAAHALLSQAASRQDAEDLDGAMDAYRTLLGIDRKNRQLYQARIAEIKYAQEAKRRRKRRARGLLAAAALLVVAALGYVSYAAAAVSELSRLPDSDPMDMAAAGRRIQRLEAMRGAYPVTLAAFEAGDRIERLREWTRGVREREEARSREARHARGPVVAEATGSFEVAVGLMERGHLEAALERLGEAISSVDELGARWAHRSLAEQHVQDIEVYIEEGERFFAEGRDAWAAGDLAAAHAALREVIQTYRWLPALGGEAIEVPVRVVAFPRAARIVVSTDEGTIVSGSGQLEFAAPHDRLLSVNVTLDGHVAVTRQIDPGQIWSLSVVLERAAAIRVTVEEPVAALRPLSDGRMALVARNGKVGFMQMGDGHARTWERGATLLSAQSRPAISQAGILVATESGLLRLVDRSLPRQSWGARLDAVPHPRYVLPPVALGSDFVVGAWGPDDQGVIARLSSAVGRPVWEFPCRGPAQAVATGTRGVAVVDGHGALHLIDPLTGALRRKLAGPFGGTPARASGGRLLVHKVGEGVISMTWDGADPRVVLATSDGIIGGPLDFDGTIVVAQHDRLVVGRGEDLQDLSVGIPVVALVGGPSRCAARLADGRVLVIDPSARSIAFAARGGRTGSSAAIALTRAHLTLASGPRELSLVPLH
ncbi:MAG: DUF4388 domain-containing protein [Planctomycetota bacterium]|nr:DUF4388 domain-containing protein [Planctomycetota bacterium]